MTQHLTTPLVSIRNLGKIYPGNPEPALFDICFDIEAAAQIAVTGPSGCGKSTLLNIIGTLDAPTEGEILYRGKGPRALGPLPAFRARNIGFVFQFHHLLPTFTLAENVEAPLVPLGLSKSVRREKSAALLSDLGLFQRRGALPHQVSGGERQRIAVARALVAEPRLVLADEPTGQLDSKTGDLVMEYLIEFCAQKSMALVVVTHNEAAAALMGRRVRLKDGRQCDAPPPA